MGKNGYGESGHPSTLCTQKMYHLIDEVGSTSVSGAPFLHLPKDTFSMKGHAAQTFESENLVKLCL